MSQLATRPTMETRILYLFTRTPLHVGAGASVGAIDQPIIRERHTGFPVIPGSSIKGVLRDYFGGNREGRSGEIDRIFGQGSDGENFAAGHISFGEAKLVAFPVRSAKGAFALAVSPSGAFSARLVKRSSRSCRTSFYAIDACALMWPVRP